MNTNIKNKVHGFLIIEAIIALALFSICIFSTITLSFGSRKIFEEAKDKQALLNYAEPIIADPSTFYSDLSQADYGNDANVAAFSTSTDSSISNCNSNCNSNFRPSVSFSFLETPDIFSAYGKDTCQPILNFSNKISSSTSSALPISSDDLVTGMSVKDNFAYISANSTSSADADLFIFDLSDIKNPKLISSLNTGPGLAALTVAGPYVFAANESSINQLQVIDIHDRAYPSVVAQEKVPLDISSSTAPSASAIFYDKGFVYLGTEKGDNPELTIWNAADPTNPILVGRYEIGNKVEKIFVQGSRAYIAGTGANQLMVFDVSNPTNPVLLATMSPGGWQTQSGQALDLFEGELAIGRDTGGYNNTANPEFIDYGVASSSQQNPLVEQNSFDEPGGIYGIVARPPNFLALTHRSTGQLRIDDAYGTTSAAYNIPGNPAAISCDWGNIFIASNNNPSITLIKDFQE